MNSLEEYLSLSNHVRSVFDTGEYAITAENFSNKMNNIKSKYKGYSEGIHLEEPSLLLKKIKDLKKKIDDLKEELIYGGEKEILSKWEDYVKETKNFTSNIEYIVDTLRKQAQLNVEEIQIDPKKIEEIKNKLNYIRNCVSVNIKEFNLKLSELEKMKNNMRDVLYDMLNNILTKDELRLLEYIVGELRGKTNRWLSVEEIYQFAKSNLQLDHSEVGEALKKLVNRKILKEGITLAF
jgi:DNA repair ATPase RecN